MVDDSERSVKLIMDDSGKTSAKWCVTENGLIQIINTVYADDENERVCSELSIKKSFNFFLESELQEQLEYGAEYDQE